MNDIMRPRDEQVDRIIRQALQEDIGSGDITTLATVPNDLNLAGQLIVKSDGVVAGLEVFQKCFLSLDERVTCKFYVSEGQHVGHKQIIADVAGPGRAILSAERVALNLLQRMSGIATLTSRLVEAVRDMRTVILDTRKTAPGLRELDKWAVRLGGGHNHRFGLFDMVMIKENHISAAGGLTKAVNRVRGLDDEGRLIEVEVKNLSELAEALELGVDRIMLDNMTTGEMRQAVKMAGGRVPLEASGNVSLANVRDIAATGVDYISCGALTHSVRALDISFIIT